MFTANQVSHRLHIHHLYVINDQILMLRGAVLDRIVICDCVSAWEHRPELPETIIGNLSILYYSYLPLLLYGRSIRALSAVLFQHDWLA
jgi:hypothetical protein